MGFFSGVPLAEIKSITHCEGNELNHTLSALRLSGKANGVSKAHLQTLKLMWAGQEGICDIISITNAQNFSYWHDEDLYKGLRDNNDGTIQSKKITGKQHLFEIVADQCGEIYDEKIFTIVFAKRFARYKRADLLLQNMERFHQLVTNKERPVQIIWAGKPYPMDYTAIGIFDRIVNVCKTYTNCATLVGYELKLSKILKLGADIWLNVPLLTHEASGTSGITATMNGAINVAIPDGWFPEFAKDKINSFVIPPASVLLPEHEQNEKDASTLYDLLEKEILPMYYNSPNKWLEIIKNGLTDIIPAFDSNRMAKDYYEKLYRC
jgi:starch phosphorylase